MHSRRFLLSLGLLTALALTGCDLYAPKKKDAQPQSQTDTKKEAPEGPDAEAGLEEGAPPTTPEPPAGGAPSATAPSGEGNQSENRAASSPGGQTPPGEVPPPSAAESTPPSESSGPGATPPKPAPENP
ncbi:MAG: hypothetical protein PHP75_01535 [Methylacidiphilaceae bacterium]|nr:hypothetical protein [Candidatus Methylacidiphilaceae bacterium]